MDYAEEKINQAEKFVEKQFEYINEIRDYNQKKVLQAFIDNRVAPEHFYTVSGYGHDDLGREVLDKVYASVFKSESAIVRNHFTTGTHTLACALFGNLHSGDELISVAGKPYDTMREVIGLTGCELSKRNSLIGNGVKYNEVPLLNNSDIDFDGIKQAVGKNTKMVTIQRSRGYDLRKSLTIDVIARICDIVHSQNPDCICFVDNCYGEFTEKYEPIEVRADLLGGSLIKNPGGGLVETGGYIAGKKDLVEASAIRLTAPGVGSEAGAMLNQHRLIFQGLFMAPSVVSDVLKGLVLAAKVFEDMGFVSTPKYDEKRTDIIQTIAFNDEEHLINFCKTVQSLSPINSYVTPFPELIPGYEDKVIMAGGTFIEGSTIELSADGPIRPPYAVYMQGGLNYAHLKLVVEGIYRNLAVKIR